MFPYSTGFKEHGIIIPASNASLGLVLRKHWWSQWMDGLQNERPAKDRRNREGLNTGFCTDGD